MRLATSRLHSLRNRYNLVIPALLLFLTVAGAWPCASGQFGQPAVTLDPRSPTYMSGHAYNVNINTTKVVIYAFTNQWWVQPYTAAPFTSISAD